MGMYCCCGKRISSENFDCECDWDGWISDGDWPPERKNKKTPIQKMPEKSGSYLARYSTTSGDRYEQEAYFSVDPLKMGIHQVGWCEPEEVPVHWEPWDSETLGPYAWKRLPEPPND